MDRLCRIQKELERVATKVAEARATIATMATMAIAVITSVEAPSASNVYDNVANGLPPCVVATA